MGWNNQQKSCTWAVHSFIHYSQKYLQIRATIACLTSLSLHEEEKEDAASVRWSKYSWGSVHSLKLFSQEEGCDEDASMCLKEPIYKKYSKVCGKARQAPTKQHTIRLNPPDPHVGTETLWALVVDTAEAIAWLFDQIVNREVIGNNNQSLIWAKCQAFPLCTCIW